MGLFAFFKKLFAGKAYDPAGDLLVSGMGVEDLATALGMQVDILRQWAPTYKRFSIPKRSGGTRDILAPDDGTKQLQRMLLKKLLGRLPAHPAATGFRRGLSIADNARPHQGRAVVVRMDVRDFFSSTPEKKVVNYFRAIGWSKEAASMLGRLCTHEGALPQGAPTSPVLSNLVNHRLDARLTGLARAMGSPESGCCRNPRTGEAVPPRSRAETLDIAYTRYADDLTFSFSRDWPFCVRSLINAVTKILYEEGYRVNRRKTRIRRRHQRQQVTGLVINETVNLPRPVRRKLRAARHHLATGRPATLTPEQLAGWEAFEAMVRRPVS